MLGSEHPRGDGAVETCSASEYGILDVTILDGGERRQINPGSAFVSLAALTGLQAGRLKPQMITSQGSGVWTSAVWCQHCQGYSEGPPPGLQMVAL